MTDSRLSFTARAIILLLGLSLLVMLGVTIKERVSKQKRAQSRPSNLWQDTIYRLSLRKTPTASGG